MVNNRPYIEDLDEMMAEIIADLNSNNSSGNGTSIMDNILEECVKLLQQAIKEKVYDYYPYTHPYGYYRGYSALNRKWIDVKSSGIGVADIVIKPYSYESAVFEDLDVRENVWHWVNYGHDDGIGEKRKGYNQYHRYEGRFFLEYAKKLIEETYEGVKVTIIDEYPWLNY